MNRRAQLQLRLQQTVEGLSVAAITYYAVGSRATCSGSQGRGAAIDADLAPGSRGPIAVVVALGVRHIRHSIRRRLLQGPASAVD